MISCIILAAGESRRFGSPKALAKINGQALIDKLITKLKATAIDEIVVVLGAYSENIKPFLLKHKHLKIVYNKDHILGQTSSFKTALAATNSLSKGILLHPIDFPFIKTETITTLISHFHQNHSTILIPTFNNQKGHPPLFNNSLRDEFLSLPNSVGINSLAQRHATETKLLPLDDKGIILSFNTPEEWKKINEEFGESTT